MQLFNDHPIRTEKNWTPNQIWTPENPLAHGNTKGNNLDIDYLGIDPNGPSPFEDSPNDVSVPDVVIEGNGRAQKTCPRKYWSISKFK